MGLVPGTRFSVVRHDACSPLVIRVHGSSVALGQRMAGKMVVERQMPKK